MWNSLTNLSVAIAHRRWYSDVSSLPFTHALHTDINTGNYFSHSHEEIEGSISIVTECKIILNTHFAYLFNLANRTSKVEQSNKNRQQLAHWSSLR